MQLKTVKLIFDSQFCGYEESSVKIPAETDDLYIQSLFEEVLGVPYNEEDCRYGTEV